MGQVYYIFKSFVDPLFIIFVLLLIAFFVCLLSGKKKSGALFLFFTLILLYGVSIQPVSNYLSYQLEKPYLHSRPLEEKEPLDAIVVLSGGTYDIKKQETSFCSASTVVRLAYAVRMFKDYKAKYLICSGKGDSSLSGAELMAQLAQDFGIPKERIRLEARSANTYEHAQELNKMFSRKDMRIGLVTSAYHMRRSEKEFKKFFPKIVALPSDYLYALPVKTPVLRYIPQSEWLSRNTLVFREYMGQIWYGIKGM